MSYVYGAPVLDVSDHTQRRSTVGRTPVDEWSARRRDLYLTTHDTHNRQISMPPVGFEPKISAGERPVRVSMKLEFFSTDFRKVLKFKFHRNPVSRSRDAPWGRKDGQPDTTKLTAAVLKSAKTTITSSELRGSQSGTDLITRSTGIWGHISWYMCTTNLPDQLRTATLRIVICVLQDGCSRLLRKVGKYTAGYATTNDATWMNVTTNSFYQ